MPLDFLVGCAAVDKSDSLGIGSIRSKTVSQSKYNLSRIQKIEWYLIGSLATDHVAGIFVAAGGITILVR